MAERNLTIKQGDTFTLSATWKDSGGSPVDLTGYTATFKATCEKTSTTSLINLSSPSSGIILGGALGTIDVTMTDTQTAALDDIAGFYELKLISGSGVVTTILEGAITVKKGLLV